MPAAPEGPGAAVPVSQDGSQVEPGGQAALVLASESHSAASVPNGQATNGQAANGQAAHGTRAGEAGSPGPAAEPARAAAVAAQGSRSKPGSLDDLRRRLERLPHGHPSSPYHDDGERKPPPPRLKHLELAPPRALPARTSAVPPARPIPPIPPVPAAPPPLVSETSLPASPSPALPPAALEPPASAPNPSTRAPDPVAPVAPPPPSGWPAPVPPSATEQAPQAAGPGPAPGPATGPRLAADGSWSWGRARLSRDLVRIADDAYERFRAAEGRDLFGRYGTNGLTPMLMRIAGRIPQGGLARDTEQHALADPDVFRARFAELLNRDVDHRPEQLARQVPGALSYAFVFDAAHYADGIRSVHEALDLQGFQLLSRRNTWSGEANKCVVTMWHDPLSGLPFGVQFHTAASIDAQHLARTSTALIHDPRIPASEVANLRSDIEATWAALPLPPGHAEINDYVRDLGGTRRSIPAAGLGQRRPNHAGAADRT